VFWVFHLITSGDSLSGSGLFKKEQWQNRKSPSGFSAMDLILLGQVYLFLCLLTQILGSYYKTTAIERIVLWNYIVIGASY
jgi:CobQ-like glutamine amidotransferase family enzyme